MTLPRSDCNRPDQRRDTQLRRCDHPHHTQGEHIPVEARYLYMHQGLELVDVEKAKAGDIVVVGGLEEAKIGETLADPEHPEALPTIHVEEPTRKDDFWD